MQRKFKQRTQNEMNDHCDQTFYFSHKESIICAQKFTTENAIKCFHLIFLQYHKIEAVFKKFDRDKDGVLSFEEFQKMINREKP